MIVDLLPEFGYSRVTKRGVVILKDKWYSFKKTILTITDLYLDVFPKRLSDSCKKSNKGNMFDKVFSNDIYVFLQLRKYKKSINIADYVWEKYNVLHREVPTITITIDTIMLSSTVGKNLPVISPVSSLYLPSVETLLKKIIKKDSVESLVEKISKIRARGQQAIMRMVDLHPQYLLKIA